MQCVVSTGAFRNKSRINLLLLEQSGHIHIQIGGRKVCDAKFLLLR